MKNKNIPSLSLRKLLLSALVAAPVATLPAPLWALPASQAALDAEIVGNPIAGVTANWQSGNVTISTTANNTLINWLNFGAGNMSIGAGDILTFNQPSTTSAVLNYVSGSSPTSITGGSINSNGTIYVLNKNGIVVTGGTITAAGLGLSAVDDPLAVYNFSNTGTLTYTGAAQGVSVSGATINVGTSGTVTLAGNPVSLGGTITAGNVNIVAGNGTSAVSGLTISGGNLNVTAANGTVQLAQTGGVTVGGNLTVTSNGGAVAIGNGGTLTVSGSSATLNTSGGAISQGANAFTVGTGTANANLNLNTAGNGTVTLSSVSAAGGKVLVATINAGATSLTSSSDVQLAASTVNGALTVTTSGAITSGGNVAVKAGSNIALTAGAAKSITYATAGDATFSTLSTSTGNISVTAGGNVSLPTLTATNLTVTAAGNITGASAIAATGVTTLSGNQVTLSSAFNSLPTLVLKNGAAGITINQGSATTLANGTSTTGNVSLTTNSSVAFGNAASDVISIGGDLSVNTLSANGSVTQATNNMTVSGSSTYTLGTGTLTLTGSGMNAVGLNNQYGQINVVSSGGVSVYESTTLNLGNITTAGNLLAYSKTGITNSGALIVGGTTTVGAGTAAAPGPIALNWVNGNATASNQLTGAVRIIDEVNLNVGTAATLSNAAGVPLASSISISNQNATSFALGSNFQLSTPNIPVTITGVGTGSITAGVLNTSGLVTLNSDTGAISATDVGNQFTNVMVSSKGGAVAVSSAKDLTVNATLTTASANAVSFTSAGNLTLGTLSSAYNGTLTFNATAGKITDSVAGIAIFGPVSFNAPGSVSVTQAGHNFGGVNINTSAGNGSIAFVESGTLRLTTISAGAGNVSLASTNGDIIQTAGTGVVTSGTATFTANNGSVVLNQGASNAMKGTVSVSAMGNSTINQATANALKLGNVVVSAGTLSVDASGTGAAITQNSGTTINVFGATSFTNTGANAITVGNSGNRFGALSLSTGSGNITVKEATTLNVAAANTTGALSLTSEGGDIVDSGAIGNVSLPATAQFTATNITLDATNLNLASAGFTATGNVVVNDQSGSLNLLSSTVGGTFTATTTGSLTQTGTLTILGDTTFIATTGIDLQSLANQFGAVLVKNGSGGVALREATTFNLRSGSLSNSPVVITTGGNFITSGVGSSSFAAGLTVNAIGTITFGAGSILMTGGILTVDSANTKDLSQLSFSTNLSSTHPDYKGSGSNIKPPDEPSL